MTRKSIPKKLRFEVLKRDSFQCQYCGASAPDVLLQIDHVHPVASGGENDILNLITSCEDCNSGKGARHLDDNSALAKQQKQLADLQERREQLELMIQWKEELTNLNDTLLDRVCEYWSDRAGGYSPTETGRQKLRGLVKQFGYPKVIDAIEIAVERYLKYDGDKPTRESVGIAFEKVSGILRVNKSAETKPYIKDLFYVRGILRNRVYVNEREVMSILEDAVAAGVSVEDMKRYAATCTSWTDFCQSLR